MLDYDKSGTVFTASSSCSAHSAVRSDRDSKTRVIPPRPFILGSRDSELRVHGRRRFRGPKMTLPENLCETDAKPPQTKSQPPPPPLQSVSDQAKPSLPQPIANVGHRLESNLKGDRLNFLLLLLLYTMQGFPMGLTSAIPILLQDKNNGSYQDQVRPFCYSQGRLR